MEQILTINDSAGPTPPNWATFSGTGPLLRVSIGCAAGLTIGQADEDRLRRWLVQREVARAQEMPERVRAALMRGVAQYYETQPWEPSLDETGRAAQVGIRFQRRYKDGGPDRLDEVYWMAWYGSAPGVGVCVESWADVVKFGQSQGLRVCDAGNPDRECECPKCEADGLQPWGE